MPSDLTPPAARTPNASAAAKPACECPDCGLLQAVPALPRRSIARCPRCRAVLRRARRDPFNRSLALTCTGLLLFLMATNMPFIQVEMSGFTRQTTLITGPVELEQHGMWELSLVVMITTILAPLARLLAMITVLVGLRLSHPPRILHALYRWSELLRPWSMVEVFLLGMLVAYTKLVDLAQVNLDGAAYALGGLMLAMAAADAALDPHAVWSTLERRGLTAAPVPRQPEATPQPAKSGPTRWVSCSCCELVTAPARTCPRCGGRLYRRKPDSIGRTWALLAAGCVLYVPANLLPVMTVINLGRGEPSTILSGVQELAEAGMWPLALLVFVASISVPVLKLLGLLTMLITTRQRSAWRLSERTLIYRIVDSIGRWSMIDVFMVSILTALVRMGRLASVDPGPGVLAFCSVVILTMFAAMSFDPRLMWDAAAERDQPRASEPPVQA